MEDKQRETEEGKKEKNKKSEADKEKRERNDIKRKHEGRKNFLLKMK